MEKKFDQNAYIREYNEKTYDRIELKIPKGKKAEWKAKAKAEGLSLTEWITKQIEKSAQKKRDGKPPLILF